MTREEPRYINPASIERGDLIRVAWEVDGVKFTREGRVASREYEGQVRVVSAESGIELLRWVPGQSHPKVTLLAKLRVIEEPTLFDVQAGVARMNDAAFVALNMD